jgi:flagellar capping protein FliD
MRHTLKYSKQLESAGLSRELAETHLQILEEIVEDEMATKADLRSSKNEVLMELGAFRSEMQVSMQEFKAEVNQSISQIRQELNDFKSEMRTELDQIWRRFDRLEQRLVIKFGVMQAASITVMAALFKLFQA